MIVPFFLSQAKSLDVKKITNKVKKNKGVVVPVLVAVGGYIAYSKFKSSRNYGSLSLLKSENKDVQRAITAASLVAAGLGTNVKGWTKWVDPSYWWENEYKVIKVLSENSDIIKDIEYRYKKMTTRDLHQDLASYLNSYQLEKLYKKISK